VAFGEPLLIRNSVIAGFAAGHAIVETVVAQADFQFRIAEAAISLALAMVFGHLALQTAVFGLGSGGHTRQM
jgi:hypothetical protein